MPTVRDALLSAVRACARYNADAQVRPAAILWPDREGQWAAVVPALRAVLPELYVLGPYNPAERTGPAVWLKCAVAGLAGDGAGAARNAVPILYLPGWSRGDLRATAFCPFALQPLAELQYRGAVWSHPNGRDWTVHGFLTAKPYGLGLSIPRDDGTREALLAALADFLEQDLDGARAAGLTRDYFHQLVAPSPEREMLEWLHDPDAARSRWDEARWTVFQSRCASEYRFSPDDDGPLQAAGLLAQGGGRWEAVWDLYKDLHYRYPGVMGLLAKAKPAEKEALFAGPERYPALNEAAERELREALLGLDGRPEAEACAAVRALEQRHGLRRGMVWARAGRSPLAGSLEWLDEIARLVPAGGGGVDLAATVDGYRQTYWRVDAAAWQALVPAEGGKDREAVAAALRAIYRPWLDRACVHFQSLVLSSSGAQFPAPAGGQSPADESSLCLLFVDGLRYDLGRELASALRDRGEIEEGVAWSGLPSITQIGKPLASPLADLVRGDAAAPEFRLLAPDGSPLTAEKLRALLAERGWQVLGASDTGDPSGKAWTELGNIDGAGHERGARLALEIERELDLLAARIGELLEAGWRRVRVVTDHGWLLLPGGLPKAHFPPALALDKWGRCGLLKEGVPAGATAYPWPLAPARTAFTAPGAACFTEKVEYTHGGISLQENLLPVITVTAVRAGGGAPVAIESITWTRLRCEVRVRPQAPGLRADVRGKAASPQSSLVAAVKEVAGGTASLLVADADLEGSAAFMVVLDAAGAVVAQEQTVVGG